MNFDFGERESVLRSRLQELVDADAETKLHDLRSGDPLVCLNVFRDYLSRLSTTGYLALGLHDGKNSTILTSAQETLAALSPSLFLSVEAIRIFGRLTALFGTPDQKAEILGPLEQGRYIGSIALSEGGMSLGNEALETTATPLDGKVQINGSKDFVVNAPLVDRFAVIARSEGSITVAMVKPGTQGVTIGERLSTLGYEGTPMAPVTFDDVVVPREETLGPFESSDLLDTLHRWEDQALAAAGLGLMERSFRSALAHARKHREGEKPLIAYQEIGFKLAEMLTLHQTAQLLAYRSAWIDASGDSERDAMVHCAKVFCAESAEQVASQALQIFGGRGFVKGNQAEESYRHAKYLQIAGTSSEMSRMRIGDGLLERV